MAGSRWLLWSCSLVALLAIILLGRLSPMAGLFFSTWVPLPLLVVGWRLGTGEAALLALAGGLSVFALNPGLTAFQDGLSLWMLLLMGLLLTVCHNRDWSEGSGIMLTALVLGLLFLAFFGAQAYFQGLSLGDLWEQKSREITQTLTKTLNEVVSDVQVMGMPRVEVQNLLIQVLPALALINVALVAWVNVLVVQRLASLGGWGNLGEPLAHWASPEWLVFLLVAAGAALLTPLAWVRQAGLNLLLILGFVYFCQGTAVISTLLQRYRVPWVLRGLVYVLAFMNPLIIVVMLLGLMDLWLDFRRLQPPREA